jgi:hypothetical protein
MATRKERRVAKKEGKPVKLSIKLLEELANQGYKNITLLQRMLSEEIYATRLRIKAYNLGYITENEFLTMMDPYDLPIGMDGKEISIANYVLDELDRFNLSVTTAKKGDLLTAFLIDRYDNLYDVIKTSTDEDFIQDEEFQKEFMNAVIVDNSSFSDTLIINKINTTKKLENKLKNLA